MTLTVFTLDGRRIATLVDGEIAAGEHTARWNGRDVDGQPMPSGFYLYRLDVDGTVLTERMLLTR